MLTPQPDRVTKNVLRVRMELDPNDGLGRGLLERGVHNGGAAYRELLREMLECLFVGGEAGIYRERLLSQESDGTSLFETFYQQAIADEDCRLNISTEGDVLCLDVYIPPRVISRARSVVQSLSINISGARLAQILSEPIDDDRLQQRGYGFQKNTYCLDPRPYDWIDKEFHSRSTWALDQDPEIRKLTGIGSWEVWKTKCRESRTKWRKCTEMLLAMASNFFQRYEVGHYRVARPRVVEKLKFSAWQDRERFFLANPLNRLGRGLNVSYPEGPLVWANASGRRNSRRCTTATTRPRASR